MSAALNAGDSRHGTLNGYTNHRCRCQPCRAAWAAYTRQRRAARALLEPPAHGTPGAYLNWGCRCQPCRQARAAARRTA